jgi:hypothetical protein
MPRYKHSLEIRVVIDKRIHIHAYIYIYIYIYTHTHTHIEQCAIDAPLCFSILNKYWNWTFLPTNVKFDFRTMSTVMLNAHISLIVIGIWIFSWLIPKTWWYKKCSMQSMNAENHATKKNPQN